MSTIRLQYSFLLAKLARILFTLLTKAYVNPIHSIYALKSNRKHKQQVTKQSHFAIVCKLFLYQDLIKR